MFEKEAEDYSEKDLGGKYLSSVVAKDKLHAYKLGQYDGFVEGAEFGYNKAKEEGKVVVEHFEAYGQCRDSRKIAGLETENAELKDKLKNLASVAEVRLANWQKYEKELKSEKEYSATLRKEIDEYTNSHTLCAKYKELQKACDETQELLDKQIEATYKLDKENAEQKKKIENLQKYLDTQNCYRECAETWVKLTEAKKIILKLYNAGRDVLMCRTEEKAYENLSHAINDKEIEQFLNSLLSNF